MNDDPKRTRAFDQLAYRLPAPYALVMANVFNIAFAKAHHLVELSPSDITALVRHDQAANPM